MKLHSLNFLLSMTKSHDHTIAGLGRNVQAGWQTLTFDNKRMVTTGAKGRVKTLKDRVAIMKNVRTFTMNNLLSAHNPSAKDLSNGLVAQANAENRNASPKMLYQAEGN